AVGTPDAPVRELGLVSGEEEREIVEVFNDTKTALPEEEAVHRLFEAQANRTPASIAIKEAGREWTYREVNEAANRLARCLVKSWLEKGRTAAIMNDRSAETVIGMLAVLKAGGAYVPIDPAFPEDRLRFMAEDSSIRLVLTVQDYQEQAGALQVPVVMLDESADETVSGTD
ncbi:AMP-binding protein, partial [Bacillus tropicus]